VVSDPLTSGPARELPTAVWYPTKTSAGRPLGASQFPLLVFSQGFDLSVSDYDDLITTWASAGYVVAAPTYPDTDPTSPQLNESDIVNHPADLRAVISTVLGLADQPGSVFDEVDPEEVGVVGHSDGGDVSLAVADNSAYRDPLVKAVAVLSGAELASFGGSYFDGPAVPLLAVQGSADTINPPACSVQLYDQAPPPKYYLDLLGAEHEPPYIDPGTPAEEVVAQVTTEFFDAVLAGEPGALAEMERAANVPNVSELFAGTPAPPASGGCPGAPG
jgi:predicted dienelactone hydrolase